jgi:hypothetical protein
LCFLCFLENKLTVLFCFFRGDSDIDDDDYSTTTEDTIAATLDIIKTEAQLSPEDSTQSSIPNTQYPMTPGTPDHDHPGYTNESGYETSSYYSSAPSELMSPNYQQLYPSSNNGDFVSSTTVIQQQQQQQQSLSVIPDSSRTFHQHPQHYYSNARTAIEPNSEEDELLDAIANWQDDN